MSTVIEGKEKTKKHPNYVAVFIALAILTATDIQVKKDLADDKKVAAEYRDAMTQKVQDIYIMMIQLGGTPPKRLDSGIKK